MTASRQDLIYSSLLQLQIKNGWETEFTATEVARLRGIHRRSVHNILVQLADMGKIEMEQEKTGNRYVNYYFIPER